MPIVLPAVSPQRWTERMFRVFFVRQRDLGSLDALIDVATAQCLDSDGLRAALTSGLYTDGHQPLRRAHELDVTAVPTFVVGDRRLAGPAHR